MSSSLVVDRCDYSPGQTVNGKYTVRKTLGEGSFGVVYLVEDYRRQPFALKLLRLWEVPQEIREPYTEDVADKTHNGENRRQGSSFHCVGRYLAQHAGPQEERNNHERPDGALAQGSPHLPGDTCRTLCPAQPRQGSSRPQARECSLQTGRNSCPY